MKIVKPFFYSMGLDYLFNLTNGVYQVTKLFPEADPLRFKTREKALEILADLVLASPNPGVKQLNEVAPTVHQNIEILAGYFDLAQTQNWVDPKNFLVLKREYDKIKEFIKAETKSVTPDSRRVSSAENSSPLNLRQKKILEVLKEKERAQAGEILKFFGGISKRTVRRDLEKLVRGGTIERTGRCNQISYKLPS